MKHPLNLPLFAVMFFICSCSSEEKGKISEVKSSVLTATPPDGYKSLLNGNDLSGWHTVTDGNGPDSLALFAVQGGILHAYPSQESGSKQSFAGLVTDKEYGSYHLMFEFKWGEKKFAPRTENVRDAGVLFHTFNEDVFWPYGIECQIQEGDLGDLWIIGAQASTKVDASEHYDPKGELRTKGEIENKYHRFSRSNSWEVPDWNKVEVEVKGDHATFTINGKLVNEAIDMKYWDVDMESWIPLTKGKILLQAEGAEIFYRNVFIKEIQ